MTLQQILDQVEILVKLAYNQGGIDQLKELDKEKDD